MRTYGNHINVTHPGCNFIAGTWRPTRGQPYAVIDPSTEAMHDGFVLGGVEDVECAVTAARQAFDDGPWPSMRPDERGRVIEHMTQLLTERRNELEEAWTLQVGALAVMRGRAVDNGIGHFRRAAEQAHSLSIEQRVQSHVGDAIIRQEPVGVVAAIAAWNGTLLQAASKIAPALAAGCTVVFKPAPSTPLEAIIIAECAEAAGLPPGVLNVVHVSNDGADRLISDPRVDKVSFTGSTEIGRHIAQTCGRRIARYSLELGGKSAAIVLDDADIQMVGKTVARTITALTGQLCSMLSRVVVTQDRHDALVDAIASEMGKVRVGSAYDSATEMGPLASDRQRQHVEQKIAKAHAEGAKLVFGGKRPEDLRTGFFLQPTLFANVSSDSSLAQAEVFGPVLAVIPAEDEDDAVRIANDSVYGLHGAVFTPDKDRAKEIARRVRTGTFAQNGMRLDFSLPFGGYKQSGVGREGGPDAITEYLETKTIILDA